MSNLHPLQVFTPKRVHRSQLKSAPYNPRKMDAYSKRNLKKLLKGGFVGGITWNERTGNVIGGHQRLTIMDALSKTGKDYLLDVDACDVSPERERELNLALNNPSAQGLYDPELIDKMLEEAGSGAKDLLEAAAFDSMDIASISDDPRWCGLFAEDAQSPQARALAEEIRETMGEADILEENGDDAGAVDRIRESKKKRREGSAKEAADHIIVLVFKDGSEADEFLEVVGGEPGAGYLEGSRVMAALQREELGDGREQGEQG